MGGKFKLPEGKVLIPGVVAHTTNNRRAPRPDRLAHHDLCPTGRERGDAIAGTDCGFFQGAFTPHVHPSIMWAKLRALAEGAA